MLKELSTYQSSAGPAMQPPMSVVGTLAFVHVSAVVDQKWLTHGQSGGNDQT
jgi:hypothetical protein